MQSVLYREDITYLRVDTNFIKFVSKGGHVVFCLLYKHTNDDFFYVSPKISEDSLKVVRRPDKRFRTVYENYRRLLKSSEDIQGRSGDVSIRQQHI